MEFPKLFGGDCVAIYTLNYTLSWSVFSKRFAVTDRDGKCCLQKNSRDENM